MFSNIYLPVYSAARRTKSNSDCLVMLSPPRERHRSDKANDEEDDDNMLHSETSSSLRPPILRGLTQLRTFVMQNGLSPRAKRKEDPEGLAPTRLVEDPASVPTQDSTGSPKVYVLKLS